MAVQYLIVAGLAVLFAGTAESAEDPGARALQQNQLMRQQQQNTLQLRMQQEQSRVQSPPAGARGRHQVQQLETQQEQRQRELQYRQNINPPTAHSADDPGVARAKADLERGKAQRKGEAQLRRFDYERKQRIESGRTEKARGEVHAPEQPAPLQ